MRTLAQRVLVKVFVDGVWLHAFWGCHRRADRSFFVNGRQFHVCARCTGLIAGVPFSLLLLPLRSGLPFAFCAFAVALCADGVTQLAGWRTSNNKLRFLTGFGAAATFLPSLVTAAGYI